ncbi:hypothetical protein [Risungbinella massiliensis]|uniref:hypothetical protein n=1 Tax=Risungbinella massiliensis TaxID=1329796 RepID=UPI0005CBB505|nr:hypothetical protein [Risungbinella massiliensis]
MIRMQLAGTKQELASFTLNLKQQNYHEVNEIERTEGREEVQIICLVRPKKVNLQKLVMVTENGNEIHLPMMEWKQHHMNDHTKIFYGKMFDIFG